MKNPMLSGLLLGLCLSAPAVADLFLVETSESPGFASPAEAAGVLEQGILPTFDMLMKPKAGKKVQTGLPTGSRTLFLIVEAGSQDEIDRMLRELPAWGVFSRQVTPLQSLEGRAEIERQILKALKAKN